MPRSGHRMQGGRLRLSGARCLTPPALREVPGANRDVPREPRELPGTNCAALREVPARGAWHLPREVPGTNRARCLAPTSARCLAPTARGDPTAPPAAPTNRARCLAPTARGDPTAPPAGRAARGAWHQPREVPGTNRARRPYSAAGWKSRRSQSWPLFRSLSPQRKPGLKAPFAVCQHMRSSALAWRSTSQLWRSTGSPAGAKPHE